MLRKFPPRQLLHTLQAPHGRSATKRSCSMCHTPMIQTIVRSRFLVEKIEHAGNGGYQWQEGGNEERRVTGRSWRM
jgi:hypothetical protein